MQVTLPYDINHLLIKKEHFLHRSFVHGIGHSIRVSIFSSLIGEKTGYLRKGQIASVAALFHDLARSSDGDDQVHGVVAVETILPQFEEEIKAVGFSEEEIAEMKTAIKWHCLTDELPQSHPHSITTWIIKDADALDRLRTKALDGRYLRFNQSAELTGTIRDFYKKMIDNAAMISSRQERMEEIVEIIKGWLEDNSGFGVLLSRLEAFPKETVEEITSIIDSPRPYEIFVKK